MSLAQALLAFTARLEQGGFAYAISGSVASSVHGIPRTTMDVDVAVAMGPSDIPALIAALGADFYVDDAGAEAAFRYGRGFNVIYRPSKLDWYQRGGRASPQQWNDITGVLATCHASLDWPYLESQAARRGLTSLLTDAKRSLTP